MKKCILESFFSLRLVLNLFLIFHQIPGSYSYRKRMYNLFLSCSYEEDFEDVALVSPDDIIFKQPSSPYNYKVSLNTFFLLIVLG